MPPKTMFGVSQRHDMVDVYQAGMACFAGHLLILFVSFCLALSLAVQNLPHIPPRTWTLSHILTAGFCFDC